MIQIPKQWADWAKTIVAGSISGACSAILAVTGTAVIGKPLNWEQIGAVAGAGAFMSAVMYLKQSPLPADIKPTQEIVNKP